jgi:D-alanyl-D-alanine carboxypeptidase
MQSAAARRHRIAYHGAAPLSPSSMRSIPARLPLPTLLLVVALSWVPAGVAPARDRDYLPPEVQQVLQKRRIPGTSLSAFVREVGRDEPLVSYNSTVPRNPASVMKVVTTFAALETLGPAYTWRTRAYAGGPIRDQVLEGNLVLVGGGDPFMTHERWWAFVMGLRQAGIARIAGDIVIDNTYFASQGDDRGAFDDQPYRTYNVLPDALLVNFQTVTVSAVPDAATGSVRASVNPWPANLVLDNNIRLDPAPRLPAATPPGAASSRYRAPSCGRPTSPTACSRPTGSSPAGRSAAACGWGRCRRTPGCFTRTSR